MNYAIRRTTTAAAAAGADSDVVSLYAAWLYACGILAVGQRNVC